MNSGPLIDCEVTNYIRGSNPVWYFVDQVGKQADDTWYLWVLENQIPYIPANVYHDPSGTNPWTAPIQFLANGTLPIDIYYANNTIYRLEIRRNDGTAPPSQNDELIYLIEDYNPSNAIDIPTNAEGDATENQITNAQFSVVNFTGPTTYTNLTTSIEIAPGWYLDLTGLGSVTVEQVPLNNALSNPTNAPYALKLTIAGPYANAPVLKQRFSQNGMNWANKTVSTSFTALITGPAQIMTARLYASNGAALALLVTATLSNSFAQYEGYATLGASANADLPPNAYIDYKLVLPTSGEVYITSVQVVASDHAANVPYQQETIERQQDHLAHYYKPQLAYKPIPSYLIGWDFSMNPAQRLTDSIAPQNVGANKSYLSWDRTIIFQSVNNGATISRDSATLGFKLTATVAGSYAIIQYLPQEQAREILSGRSSIFLRALTSQANGYSGTVTMWVTDDATLPDLKTPNFNSLVTALDANGRPTCGNGNWTEIPRNLKSDATFDLTTTAQDFMLNSWEYTGALTSTAKYFAIVIGLEPMLINDSVTFVYASVNAGDIATRPAPKTLAETVLECQEFYYTSFALGTAPASAVGANTGAIIWPAGGAGNTFNNTYLVSFPVVMRNIPIITTYNPVAAGAEVQDLAHGTCSATSTATYSSRKNFVIGALGNASTTTGSSLGIHITADAELGIKL